MRIYSTPLEAVREVERDLWEMGVRVHPQTMQDKDIHDDPNYETIEMQGYAFKIVNWQWNNPGIAVMVNYVLTGKLKGAPATTYKQVMDYIEQEFSDRVSGEQLNPGNAWEARAELWNEFMHGGQFAYTYSERITPQLPSIIAELKSKPDTRQGIITIHSNICALDVTPPDGPANIVQQGRDLCNMGGGGRVPCSMFYQIMRRNKRLDLIYVMRSCDYLVHFPVDIALALRLQHYFAQSCDIPMGTFTYFAGSLHAYRKDMKARGIF